MNNEFYFKVKKWSISDARISRTKSLLSVIFSIALAFLFSVILGCVVSGKWSNFLQIIIVFFTTSFSSIEFLNRTLFAASILIVAALAFLVCQKVGLFNIGVSGQMFFGGTIATLIVQNFPMQFGWNQLVATVCSVIAGALVGALIGVLKTKFNVNEVVSSIILNWIIYFLGVFLLKNWTKPDDSNLNTQAIPEQLSIRTNICGHTWIAAAIMAFVLVTIVFFFFKDTIFGRKQINTGMSNTVALAMGYSIHRNIIIATTFSGAISGILGIIVYMGYNIQMPCTTIAKTVPIEGFNGIAVCLIALSNCFALIPISFFFSLIQIAAGQLQTLNIDSALPNVMFGVVVYGAAIVSLFYKCKPYWWTIALFKGRLSSRIRYQSNLNTSELIDYVDEQLVYLTSYYSSRKAFLNVTSSLNLRHLKSSILMNKKYAKLAAKLEKDPENFSLLTKMRKLSNRCCGLTQRDELIQTNRTNLVAFRNLQMYFFKKFNIGEIQSKFQLKKLKKCFIKALKKTNITIEKYYQELTRQLVAEKMKVLLYKDTLTTDQILIEFSTNLKDVLVDKNLWVEYVETKEAAMIDKIEKKYETKQRPLKTSRGGTK